MWQKQNYRGIYNKKSTIGYRKRLFNAFKRWFREYCQNTTLHGFRYMTVFKRTYVESLLWFVAIAAAMTFCVVLMLRVWFNFSSNPTVTIVDTSEPISGLPFPAVTICNNNKVYKPHADAIAEILLENGFDDDMNHKFFSSLMRLIRPDAIEIDNATASWALDILGFSVDKLMYKLMQPCSSMLLRCAWLGQIYDCSKIFKTVKSSEGFCCGFNYHFDLWTSYKYNNTIRNVTEDEDVFPHFNSSSWFPGMEKILHVPGAGLDVGLAVALNLEGDKYTSSVRPYVGATVLVHDPIDYPDIGAVSATVQPGHVLAATVSGTGVESADDLRSIPLNKRMCFFDGEAGKDQRYSFQTCISKCMHRRVQEFCDCLPFFYPEYIKEVRTCYLTDIACILARRQLAAIEVSREAPCDCLPQCSDKNYDMLTESMQVEDVGYESQITRGVNTKNTSFVYVYFRDGTYLVYRKQSIMGWDEFLASFGGIFGLCLGGSVLSLVELFYHIVVEFLGLRKKKEEPVRKNFPPASKMFLSAPHKEALKERGLHERNENRVFLLWNDNPPVKDKSSYEYNYNFNV